MTDTGLELKDATHVYQCSTCSLSGAPCFEALWLCQTVGQAQQRAGHVVPLASELIAAGAFHGCGLPCNVLLRVGPDGVEVTAGMSDACDEGETLVPAARVASRRVQAYERDRTDAPTEGPSGYSGFAMARAPATS